MYCYKCAVQMWVGAMYVLLYVCSADVGGVGAMYVLLYVCSADVGGVGVICVLL